MKGYKEVSLSVSAAKAKKLASNKPVNLTKAELSGTEDRLWVHPANYSIIAKAKKLNRGCRITLTEGEIIHDLNIRQGGSIWSFLKNKLYPALKPAISQALDAAVAPLAAAAGPYGVAVPAGRQILKNLTGLGTNPKRLGKGSPEMKEYMAKIRSMRKGKGFRVEI